MPLSGGNPRPRFRGVYVQGSVVVLDPDMARELYSLGYYGKPLGVPKPKGADFEAPLVMDLIEARYLVESGLLEVYRDGRRMSLEELVELGRKHYSRYDELCAVYTDLKRRGFYVTSGIKFGSDFAAYIYGPGIDHAPFIVLVRSPDDVLSASDLIRAGRLSRSVRKSFLIAVPDTSTGRVRYVSVNRAEL
ncbi:MAG: tRNA-intron lyase [Nitrososphaerota archaeon]